MLSHKQAVTTFLVFISCEMIADYTILNIIVDKKRLVIIFCLYSLPCLLKSMFALTPDVIMDIYSKV